MVEPLIRHTAQPVQLQLEGNLDEVRRCIEREGDRVSPALKDHRRPEGPGVPQVRIYSMRPSDWCPITELLKIQASI